MKVKKFPHREKTPKIWFLGHNSLPINFIQTCFKKKKGKKDTKCDSLSKGVLYNFFVTTQEMLSGGGGV